EIILTNEDSYDENPEEILKQIEKGFSQAQVESPKVQKTTDRKEAIQKGIRLAKEGDIVIITGKGSESIMIIAGGKKIHFDDREVAREILKSL
ncbi:MAG: UDP-N-acetylmuramoyl-L-alanyl-D-glutamate--2,6-diaminopimelate ligase, partial [Patescibacteria group bacterium]